LSAIGTLNEALHECPPANRQANHSRQRVFTQPGSKTVVTPLKWDVCITPESRHRSATLPIAMSSSATVEAKLADKHLAATVHCVDDEIIGWLKLREQHRRKTKPRESDSSCLGS